jgi:acetyltransferase-like isoleucine patch superfamily enzyme
MEKEKIIQLIKKTVRFFISRKGRRRVNITKTLYYNFRLFPFHIAKKLPLLIHTGVKIYNMGKIVIEGEIKTGMISIGRLDIRAQGVAKILNTGKIIFKGTVILNGGVRISNRGEIIFEGDTVIGENTFFVVHKQLRTGKYFSCGANCSFMDTDVHYTINVQTGKVDDSRKEIIIGNCNWFGNNTTVKKGTCTPDYTIAASSNTLLSKDYTNILPPYSIIGGIPAKLIASGYRRIYNRVEERRLCQFFNENDVDSIMIDLENIDEYCTKDPLPFILI